MKSLNRNSSLWNKKPETVDEHQKAGIAMETPIPTCCWDFSCCWFIGLPMQRNSAIQAKS